MTQEEITTQSEYNDKITFHANCILEEKESITDVWYVIGVTVDNMTELYANYQDAIRTLQLSDKDPSEDTLSCMQTTNYQEILQRLAYDVLEQDLYAELRDNTDLEV